MIGIELEIVLLAVTVAVACALPGVFLVLRRMALMSDAISHTVLLGIVVAFFVVEDLTSPILIVGAAATGLITVALVEAIRGTGLVKEDAAIGLVFPALFSVAVILITRFAGDVHLDTDAVLLGEIALAPFRRMVIGGVDIGPRSLWVMLAVLALNAAFLTAFYKELKLSTFDAALAAALGFSPALIHYAFMGVVSVTAVAAFDSVGSILVVAFMIVPPAAAYLLSDRLGHVLGLSAGIAALSAVIGYFAARSLDASIAGSMAGAAGALFMLVLMAAPDRGLVALARRRARQRVEFARQMLTIHLLHHEGTPAAADESRIDHLSEHLSWTPDRAERVVASAVKAGHVTIEDRRLHLTQEGRTAARRTMLG
ncbi:MAG: metal ABC transporter permease [Gemmatimonadota bacterium]